MWVLGGGGLGVTKLHWLVVFALTILCAAPKIQRTKCKPWLGRQTSFAKALRMHSIVH